MIEKKLKCDGNKQQQLLTNQRSMWTMNSQVECDQSLGAGRWDNEYLLALFGCHNRMECDFTHFCRIMHMHMVSKYTICDKVTKQI